MRRVARLPIFHNRVPSLAAVRAPGQWRHLPRWYASRRPDYLLRRGLPWLTFDAIAWLQRAVQPGLRVFEYGGGASTVFWARAGAQVVTVEHDPEWIAQIPRWLPPGAAVEMKAIPPDDQLPPTAPDPADPDAYGTDWAAFAGRTFRAYAADIDTFPDEAFDVVVIDGQARPACLKHGWRKLRRGGWLIFDNAGWPQYQAAIARYLDGWARQRFIGLAPIDGALAETDIFIRP